ncbi:hypothetical protein PYCC9005_002144 [Savitreella phatthalungensis]
MTSGGQLYETASGQLFHAGKIAICLVGLPARGKTHLSVSLCRYLSWLGVSCKAFHLGDYRRKWLRGAELPKDYFFFDGDVASTTRELRDRVAQDCMDDMLNYLSTSGENGQVVIYDAVNASEAIRRRVHCAFAQAGVQPIFIETVLTDDAIIRANVRNVKVNSPDYEGWDPQRAVIDYLRRIDLKIPHYRSMSRDTEADLQWVKMINAGQRMIVNKGGNAMDVVTPTPRSPSAAASHRASISLAAASGSQHPIDPAHLESVVRGLKATGIGSDSPATDTTNMLVQSSLQTTSNARSSNFGYLGSRIVFYLMNLHVKKRILYFARAGQSADRSYKSDAPLLPEGKDYAQKLADAIIQRRKDQRRRAWQLDQTGELVIDDTDDDNELVVWTSPRQRTVATAEYLKMAGCPVRRRPQLQAINPGVYDTLSLDEIRRRYPGEAEKHQQDPFLHRFPRAESYHDVAIRLEPVILEIEREKSDLLIIAHESVLRVIYAYFVGVPSLDIPDLKIPRHEFIEIVPESYNCRTASVRIEGVPIELDQV